MRASLVATLMLGSAGCASVGSDITQGIAATFADHEVASFTYSAPDRGVRVDARDATAFVRSFGTMLEPLDYRERHYLANALFTVARHEACLRTGYPTWYLEDHLFFRKQTRKMCSQRKLWSTEQGNAEASAKRYLSSGRVDSRVATVSVNGYGMRRESGWSNADSLNRFVYWSGPGLDGLTRTELTDRYHRVLADAYLKPPRKLGNER